MWVRCSAHAYNLVLADIGKMPWVASVVQQAHSIVKLFKNHHYSLGLLRTHSNNGSKLELLRPG
jgi:hypothetical protein